MKRILFSIVVFLIAGFTTNILGQDQTHAVNINSLHIITDRTLVMNGFGGFSMNGIDENGSSFYRQATRGTFTAPFVDCLPCRKGVSFSGAFYTDNWLTAGTSQGLSEWANLNGLTITAADWSIPVQFPFGRPIVKYIPITITGTLKVTDSRPSTYRIIYADSTVNMTGMMKVEFVKSFFRSSVEWRGVEINAAENQ